MIGANVIHDLIKMINASDFYNKFQITYEEDGNQLTETFYFAEEGIAHSIVPSEGEGAPILNTVMLDSEDVIVNRLQNLPEGSKVIVAGNSSENILTLKI